MPALIPPEGGAPIHVSDERADVLLARGWRRPESAKPAPKKKPSRTARILPVDPPQEPDLDD